MDASNPEMAADLFIGIIRPIVEKHTLIQKVPRKLRIIKPWITPGLLRCIRNRDKMHFKLRKQPNNLILKTTYTRYRNFCNSLLRKLKCEYEKTEFQKAKNNSKATWDVIKKITHTSFNASPPNELLQISSDPQTSANEVNKFFVNVGKSLADKITAPSCESLIYCSNNVHNPLGNSMVILPTDEDQIDKIILGLRENCATGWDGISAKILKNSRHNLVPPITHICNMSISTGIFPKAFKKAIVHPIYKGGDRDRVTNYRPISILTTLSKILERILNQNLRQYLAKYNIISKNQYGFRPGISTEDAVSDFTETLVDRIDKRFKCYGIFLDLSKAFDTVSVPLLISKMEQLGIRGITLDIFKDYLCCRSQCVKIGSTVSDEAVLSYGVPQGSILGPTLFLIYINDLCMLSFPNCDIFTYADDTALLVYETTWERARSAAESVLKQVMQWLSTNLLTLNLDKTKFIRFSISKNPLPLHSSILKAHICDDEHTSSCSCYSLSMVSNIRYLGVHLDEKLD